MGANARIAPAPAAKTKPQSPLWGDWGLVMWI